jgi:hypothetical protein
MPYLGDYLGQLLSEITVARLHADLETVRLAELYAAHPLLRMMPVPHVRLPEVELDIPVLIKASEEPRAGESARGGATLVAMRRKFDDVLAAHLSKAGIEPSAADSKALSSALDERLTMRGPPTETSIDVHGVADDLTSTAVHMIEDRYRAGESKEPIISPQVAASLKEAVRVEFLKLRTPPPRLTALVTSAELREGATSENLTRLHLKVSEQGVEWTTVESEGVQRDRLVPE